MLYKQKEGELTVFCDSATGSDLFGNGTRTNPYQSLRKSYSGHTYLGASKVPTLIVCRGKFSEMMADGNHACKIVGDYFGAAVFDGTEYFVIYGFFS